jgi:hypothetical protein
MSTKVDEMETRLAVRLANATPSERAILQRVMKKCEPEVLAALAHDEISLWRASWAAVFGLRHLQLKVVEVGKKTRRRVQ